MNLTEIKRIKNNLMNKLMFVGDYDQTAGLRRNVILVEGKTDKKFIEKIKNKDARCYSVNDFMRSQNRFYNSKSQETESQDAKQDNNKVIITEIISHIAQYPEFFDFPKGAEKWPLYGFVDKDDDDLKQYLRYEKLFLTDTHDLETLMISTDDQLFTRINNCCIKEDEIKSALFIADQLATYRQAIKREGKLNQKNVQSEDGTIPFHNFTKGDYINLAMLIEHINNNSADEPLSRAKLKRIHNNIINDRELKKSLNKDGSWKKSIDTFEINQHSELWLNTNGHDILSAICYKSSAAKNTFSNRNGYRFNRSFEIALSDAYDYACLKKTSLYPKLKIANLLDTTD